MKRKLDRYVDKRTHTAKYVLTVSVEMEIAQELEVLIPESVINDELWKKLRKQVQE